MYLSGYFKESSFTNSRKNIIKLHGSIVKIPLKDDSVDCILFADVLEHIHKKDFKYDEGIE